MDLQMKEQMDEGTEKYWRVLTAHQQCVLCLLVAGKTYAEVAAFLGIRPRTVRYYVDAIIDKYHVSNRTQMLMRVSKTNQFKNAKKDHHTQHHI